MMRTLIRPVAGTLLPALALIAASTVSGSATVLSTAAQLERSAPGADPATQEVRHRQYHYGDDFYYGHYPFTLNDYPPYVAAHPPRYYERAPRYRSSSCSYWSQQCVKNWGAGNSNYYGCMRYQGC